MTKPILVNPPALLTIALWLMVVGPIIDTFFLIIICTLTSDIDYLNTKTVFENVAYSPVLVWLYFTAIIMPVLIIPLIRAGYIWPRHLYAWIKIFNFLVMATEDYFLPIKLFVGAVELSTIVLLFLPDSRGWDREAYNVSRQKTEATKLGHPKAIFFTLSTTLISIFLASFFSLNIPMSGIAMIPNNSVKNLLIFLNAEVFFVIIFSSLIAMGLIWLMWRRNNLARQAFLLVMPFWISFAVAFFDVTNPGCDTTVVIMIIAFVLLLIPPTSRWFKYSI